MVAGVDEAGRGPLAGPVVAAAVVFPPGVRIDGLGDSKALSEARREALFPIIRERTHCGVAVVSPRDIDEINILRAAMRAMREAVVALPVRPDIVLVDGNQFPKSGLREKTVVKGDAKSASIMAASILAKVTRDRLMIEAHAAYPQYGFDRHKGYPSPDHVEALKRHGPCPLHRRTFAPVRQLLESM